MTDVQTLMRDIDLIEENIRNVSLTFSINLFTDVMFSEIPSVMLQVQKLFLQLCPNETIRFYATENMRKHRVVTKKVFEMLNVWMADPSGKTDYVVLEMKDGETAEDAPKTFFKILGCEKESIGRRDGLANVVSLAFPPEMVFQRSGELLDLVLNLSNIFPFQSGSAGFAFHCSRYNTQKCESYAWQKSMRHREIDIVRIPQDVHAVRQNAVKTVNWLTMVGARFIQSLGGIEEVKKRLGSSTKIISLNGGYIFQIGQSPAISDRNRQELSADYVLLYAALRPLIDAASAQAMWFDTGGKDEGEQTRDWFRRFEQ